MNDTGHMVVARIAWDVMTPIARQAVIRLVNDPDNPASQKPTTPAEADQFTAATYMDTIRPTFGDLHYRNQYIDQNNAPLDRPSEEPNAITFLEDNVETLEDPARSQHEKAEALRYTMHLVGDLHQPMHAVERITPELPSGDQGGNLFPIRWGQETWQRNLHAFWDQAGGEFAPIARPLTAQGTRQLDEMAARLERQYPLAMFGARAHDLDPDHWAAEGLELAIRDAYPGIRPGEIPSARYTQKVIDDMTEEAALAGYRLGNLVNHVFDPLAASKTS